jgi:hypothetical protein
MSNNWLKIENTLTRVTGCLNILKKNPAVNLITGRILKSSEAEIIF